MLLELVLALVLAFNKLFTENQNSFNRFIELVLFYALSFDEIIDEAWCNPSRESVNHNLSNNLEDQVETAININIRLHKGFDNLFMQLIGGSLKQLVDSEDWKKKYLGVIMIACLCHKMPFEEINFIIQPMLTFSSNQNPKIRFSLMFFLSKVVLAYEKKVIDNHFDLLFKHSLSCLNDPVLHVRIIVCEVLEKLIFACDSKTFEPYMGETLQVVIDMYLSETPVVLKEKLLSVLSNIISTIGTKILPYFDRCMEIIVSGIEAFIHLDKKLCGRLIEVAILLGKHNLSVFEASVPTFVQYLLTLQDSIDSSGDSVYHYIAYGWDTVIPIIVEKYPQFIEPVIASSVKLISKIAIVEDPRQKGKVKANEINDDEEDKTNIKTYQLSDASESIELVKKIIEQSGINFRDYLEFTENTILPLVNFESNGEIRTEAALILTVLAGLYKKLQHPNTNIALIKYLEALLKAANNEIDPNALTSQLESMSGIFKENEAFLTAEQLEVVYSKLVELLEKYTNLYTKLQNQVDAREKEIAEDNPDGNSDMDEDFDEEICELDQEIKDIEGQALGIAETFKDLLLNHKAVSQKVAVDLLERILPKFLKNNENVFDNRVGIFILEDLMEVFGQQELSNYWSEFVSILAFYSESTYCPLSQAALYGLGLTCKLTTFGFENYIKQVLSTCLKVLELSGDGYSEEEFNHARDNAISNLGKIIRYQSASLTEGDLKELVGKWLSLLPLCYDVEENEFNVDLVSELVENGSAILTHNEVFFKKAIEILVTDYTRCSKAEENLKARTVKIVKNLASNHREFFETFRKTLALAHQMKLDEMLC